MGEGIKANCRAGELDNASILGQAYGPSPDEIDHETCTLRRLGDVR